MGGYAQLARWNAECLGPLPEGMSLQQSMAIGAASFTAIQYVMALERNGVKPGPAEVVVTGAGGGVGDVAIAIALCGLAGGSVFTTTVMPFILRGVSLLGINSVMVSRQERRAVWDRLSRDLPLDFAGE